MSIAAKQTMLKNLEKALRSELTYDNIVTVIDALSSQLDHYNVETLESNYPLEESNDLLTAFIEAKQVEGRSEKTLERYEYIINKLIKELNVPIRNITIYHLRSYLMKMKKDGMSDNTIEGTRSIFNSFFGWLQKEGLLRDNPCANINTIKCIQKVRLPYADTDIEKLKEVCSSVRDKAIISFLLCTGCRVSEVCELNRDSIDFQNMECIVHGKGNKERVVFINPVTAMLVERYLQERKDSSPALFIGKGTTRMSPGGIRFMLTNAAKKANVENVHPHRFRRTLATNLINRGMPIQEVSTILGHTALDTTMTYIYTEKSNVKNSYNKYM